MNPLQLGRIIAAIFAHSQKLKNINAAAEMGGPHEGCSEWDSGFHDDLHEKEEERLLDLVVKKFGVDQSAAWNAWNQYQHANRWFNHVTMNPQEPLTGRNPKPYTPY